MKQWISTQICNCWRDVYFLESCKLFNEHTYMIENNNKNHKQRAHKNIKKEIKF
jgi:hypothetical protein